MKTTVEIPDQLFRQAKALSAERGIPLKQLFAEALKEKVRHKPALSSVQTEEPAWMQAFGGLRDLRSETRRIEKVIEKEFEQIDEEEWR